MPAIRICTLDGPRGTKQGHDNKVSLHIETGYPDLGGRWYHRLRPLTERAGGFDVRRDVQEGHGPLGRMLFGSNAHHVVRQATCPVLVVRPGRAVTPRSREVGASVVAAPSGPGPRPPTP